MKKTVKLNGENIKVNFEMVVGEIIKTTKVAFGTNADYYVSLFINDKLYADSFICRIRTSKRRFNEGKVSLTYECTETGETFGDSHKKLIEHLIN